MQTDLSPAKQLSSSKYMEALNKSAPYTAIAILLIISIGVYLNTLPNEFVYDDKFQVLNNPWIKNIRYIPEIFLTNVWAFVGEENLSNYYRPLMHIIYMINYHIFGFKPWGFHLTNILLHGGVSVLLFLLLSVLINQSHDLNSKFHPEQVGTNSKSKIKKSKIKNPKSQILNLKSQILSAPFIAALLFAAHPIHTEAVTWIGGIPELSFTLFYLFSFYLYIYPVRDKSLNRIKVNGKWGNKIILSAIFFFLATLCKEPALTLPLLMLVYDYSFRKDTLLLTGRQASPFSSKTLYHLIRRYLPYLIVSIIYFILRTYALGGFAPLPKRHTQLSNYEYFINVFPLFTQYLEKLILPINMNAFYVFHPISSIVEWKGIIAVILTLGFIFLVYFFRRHKVVFLSLLLMVIPLLPVLYIPALGENTFADRYLYLPSIGFVILISTAIPALCNNARVYQFKVLRQSANFVVISILVILTGLYSAGTIKRNYIWRDSYTLWTDTVEKSSDGHIPHNNLGLVYFKQQRFDEAIKEYTMALKLNPNYAEAHNNLGVAYREKGEINKAIGHYEIAIKLNPDYDSVYNNLGVLYFEIEEIDKAIEHYQTALKLKPEDPDVYTNLGNAYSAQGKFDEAIREYLIALKLKPDYPEPHYNLAFTYSKHGRFDEAIKEYMITIKLKPDYAKAHYNLGNTYFAQGKFEEARREYLIALGLKPEDVGTHYNIGNTYFEQRRFDEAIKEYLIAVKLKPEHIGAHYNLGLVYLEKGLKHKAEEEFKTALKLRPDFSPAKKALESIK